MTLETLRIPLLLSLVTAVAWIAAGICLGDTSTPFEPIAASNLCIHR